MKRKDIIKNNQLSELHTFVLGGYEQKVLIEGKNDNLPVCITLHGGPGTPIPFSVGCRGLFPNFTDKFIMVYWDQLGCGINNREIDDSFTIHSFVQMTIDLIRKIEEMFPSNKKYIFATSWGSILSAKLLEQHPQIVDGVVVNGQLIKNFFFNEEVFDALRKSNISEKKMARIKNINRGNYTSSDLQLISTSLQKYTDAYTNKRGKKAPVGKIIMGLLTSPDYKFADFEAIMMNGYRRNSSLWKEILEIDLTQILENVQVPYIIMQGDTDIVASTRIVKELVSKSNNEYLKCMVVKNTGHFPSEEMMERIYNQLISLEIALAKLSKILQNEFLQIQNVFYDLKRKYGDEFNWHIISKSNKSFVTQLKKELGSKHPLYNRDMYAIAKCDSNDDVLFLSDNNEREPIYYIFHLTYSESNLVGFPTYIEFTSIEDVKSILEQSFIKEYL